SVSPENAALLEKLGYNPLNALGTATGGLLQAGGALGAGLGRMGQLAGRVADRTGLSKLTDIPITRATGLSMGPNPSLQAAAKGFTGMADKMFQGGVDKSRTSLGMNPY